MNGVENAILHQGIKKHFFITRETLLEKEFYKHKTIKKPFHIEKAFYTNYNINLVQIVLV